MEGQSWNPDTAVRGAAERLVPILMTALGTALALLPLAVTSGVAGNEIEGPMPIVILGGLIISTALILNVLPTLALRYGRFEQDERAKPPVRGDAFTEQWCSVMFVTDALPARGLVGSAESGVNRISEAAASQPATGREALNACRLPKSASTAPKTSAPETQ